MLTLLFQSRGRGGQGEVGRYLGGDEAVLEEVETVLGEVKRYWGGGAVLGEER